ncbi:hypothetical protein MRX96_006023 [Rhipicephalus microplus]
MHSLHGRLRPVSVGRQRDLHEVLPKVRRTSLHLERRTGVLACFQLQPLRTRTPFDAQPRSSTRVCVASELCRRLVIARTCNGSDFHSTSSGTELLLRSQHRTSSVHNLRKSKITIKVPVGILVLDVMPATLVALEAPPETAGGLKSAVPCLGLAHDELLLREHQRVKIGFRRCLPRRGLRFSAPVEGPCSTLTKGEQRDGQPAARRRL